MPAASFGSVVTNVLKEDCSIKNVWNHNLHEEFHVIRQVNYSFNMKKVMNVHYFSNPVEFLFVVLFYKPPYILKTFYIILGSRWLCEVLES